MKNVGLVTLPFFFFFLIYLCFESIQVYYPYTAVSSCFVAKFIGPSDQPQIHIDYSHYEAPVNVSIALSLVIILIENLLFALAVYKIRHVSDDFNITYELKFAYGAWGLAAFWEAMLVSFGPGNMAISWLLSPYLVVIRNFSLFIVTVVAPVRASFSSLHLLAPN